MYNKSEIMRLAHNKRREFHCSMSTALKMAWVAVKTRAIIDRYDSESFITRMHDSCSVEECTNYRKDNEFIDLSNRYVELWESATREAA